MATYIEHYQELHGMRELIRTSKNLYLNSKEEQLEALRSVLNTQMKTYITTAHQFLDALPETTTSIRVVPMWKDVIQRLTSENMITVQTIEEIHQGLSTLYHVVSIEAQEPSSEELVGSTPQPV